ncbi:MAG: hypothetical protein WCF23_11570 [Candidatus Nitrosopolaris sp.]
MSDPIPAGVPLTAGAGGPEPFNANDMQVMKAFVCNYMCQRKGEDFNRLGYVCEDCDFLLYLD